MNHPSRTPLQPLPASCTRRQSLAGLSALAATAVGAALRPAMATPTRPILIQFSHVVKTDTPKGRAAQRFKELAEAHTAGRVRVEIYPDSQLYKDREEVDALRLGAVQMLAPSLSKLAALSSGAMEVFDLPYLFSDQAAFDAVAQGPVGATLLARLQPQGIDGLAIWNNGFKVFTANRPLNDPADLRGLRVRVQASRVLVEQMKALGAVASVSPLVDVYAALRAGELDGEENTPSNIFTQRLQEVQSSLSVTRHGYLGYAVIVNRRFWLGLPADIRTTLEQAVRDATAFANAIAESENREALRRITASGTVAVSAPTAEQARRWRAAMMPARRKAEHWIDPSILAAVMRAAGASP